jgi:hypothetical protein
MPDVSIFLIDGRVASKKVGRSFPPDILSFALPLAPDPADGEIDDVAARPRDRSVGVGMEASELWALFGAPKHQVSYTFNDCPLATATGNLAGPARRVAGPGVGTALNTGGRPSP